MPKKENVNTETIGAIDGSTKVTKSEAGKLLKEHNNKVMNGDVNAFVSLKDINKIYPNGIQAVYDFNIDIKEHDFIVLVGPSGCGKSTTLRMVAGLEDITSGYLYINKVLSNYLASKDRDISMVFQSYALYPQMTVFDNIAFPLRVRRYRKARTSEILRGWDEAVKALNRPQEIVEANLEAKDKNLKFSTTVEYVATKLHISDAAAKILASYHITNVNMLETIGSDGKSLKEKILSDAAAAKKKEEEKLRSEGYTIDDRYRLMKDGMLQFHNVKLSKEEIRNKVFEAAKILDLGPYLDRRPKELSGGQMQRVALGRAIVRDAKLFLMDEPLSNLDAKLRVQMRSEIVRIHEQIGATTIYVTHDQTEAMTMATKIAVMSKGWVQQIGEPQEIYAHPKNIFVATFIGSPAMNIFDGTYENGILSLKDGYQIKLNKEFIRTHDDFYKRKLADIDRMLETDSFKKMHALKILDEKYFHADSVDPEHLEKELREIIDIAKAENDTCASVIPSGLEKFVSEHLGILKDQMAFARQRNELEKMKEIREVASTIQDDHGKAVVALLDEQIRLQKELVEHAEKKDTDMYEAYLAAVRKSICEAEKYDDRRCEILAQKLRSVSGEGDLPKDCRKWMAPVRKELLTFEKIPSADIGKLHNAQVFSQGSASSADTMYYKKSKDKQKKKKEVKVNLNSVDVRFINNLYEIAQNLHEQFTAALKGKHPVRVGIRPEHIHLDEEYASEGKTAPFTVRSEVVELMGSELLIHTPWNGAEMIAKISTGTLVKPHMEVHLTFNGEKVMVFDEGSGDTIQ